MRIAYLTNQYPAVSHTFIRREIKALELLGVSILRFALKPGANLVDPDDKKEEKQTRFILRAPVAEFVWCLLREALLNPCTFIFVFWQAARMGWLSDRGILRHFAYVAEATVLAGWCRSAKADHLHAHFGTNSAAVAMFSSRFSGIPYSFTAHGSEEFEKAPLLSLDKKLACATFAVCVSFFGRAQLMRWSMPSEWDKISVIHCALDAAFFDQPIAPLPSAAKLVCVGRLDEHKAQIVLVRAASRLRKDGVKFKVTLVGDGLMRPYVEKAIHENELQDIITITGWVPGDRVKKEIESARVLILPSFSENMPVVIMEALALGRPVISTFVAGIPELVQPGNTGWLVPASDDIALATAMRDAIEASEQELIAMGHAGRQHILEGHQSKIEAQKLVALFQKSIDGMKSTTREMPSGGSAHFVY